MVLYNAFKKYRVTTGWATGHEAIDYATPLGFKFGAPEDGTYYRMPDQLGRYPGQAGRWGYLKLSNGKRIYFCHLDKHIAAHGQKVKKGDILAATGNTGYVLPSPTSASPHNGAHMHTYGLTDLGIRWDWTIGSSATLPVEAPASVDNVKYTTVQRVLTSLNLRKTPGGTILTTMPSRALVWTGQESGSYIATRYKDPSGKVFEGYAHVRYMMHYAKRTTAALNLRSRPTTDSKIIKVIPKNSEVRVNRTNTGDDRGSWAYVKHGSTYGWVSVKYLK